MSRLALGARNWALHTGFVLCVWIACCNSARAEELPEADKQQPWADGVAAQLGLDLHPGLGGTLSVAYAFRPKLLGGVAAGFAWREEFGFERHILGALHFDVFARYLVNDFVHADLGLTYFEFVNTDDTSCPEYYPHACGEFFGAFTTVGIGYRFIFVAARLRFGRAGYEDGHSKWGAILSVPLLRLVLSF